MPVMCLLDTILFFASFRVSQRIKLSSVTTISAHAELGNHAKAFTSSLTFN